MIKQTQHTQQHIDLAKKFLANKHVQFYFDAAQQTAHFNIAVMGDVWTDGTSLWSDAAARKVQVHTLCLSAQKIDDDWLGGAMGAAHYDSSTWNDTGLIYTDDGFEANLKQHLCDVCDFDAALWSYLNFEYSERGAQCANSVNFDVMMVGDFWCAVQHEMELDSLKLQAKAFA